MNAEFMNEFPPAVPLSAITFSAAFVMSLDFGNNSPRIISSVLHQEVYLWEMLSMTTPRFKVTY